MSWVRRNDRAGARRVVFSLPARDNRITMSLADRIVVVLSKSISMISTALGLGAGETWPGEIALRLRPHIARSLAGKLSDGVILVAGTNGKTTTSLMVKTILEHIGDSVVHNATGANLLNGVVSAFIRNADWLGRVRADAGIFEIDENSLPILLRYVVPKRVILLNLFRDQLDRYGEVDVIMEKWQTALSALPKNVVCIINSDDPGVAALGREVKGSVIYFGVSDPTKYNPVREHATDSAFCPTCGERLTYDGVYYSHIGVWRCTACGNKRPVPSVHTWPVVLPGLYNLYNTLAAVALAQSLDIPDAEIKKALRDFVPAFGRQEEVTVGTKTVKIFLSKNPTGFNASLRTVRDMHGTDFLLVLNDRIPDGTDVSWIWDVDVETIPASSHVTVSGDRVYDMAVRMKYTDGGKRSIAVRPRLGEALAYAIRTTPAGRILYVLATYSAMLEIRKILTGKKI